MALQAIQFKVSVPTLKKPPILEIGGSLGLFGPSSFDKQNVEINL